MNAKSLKWGEEVSRRAGWSAAKYPMAKPLVVREWYDKLDDRLSRSVVCL